MLSIMFNLAPLSTFPCVVYSRFKGQGWWVIGDGGGHVVGIQRGTQRLKTNKKNCGTAFLSKTSDIGTYWKRLRPHVCLNRINVYRFMDGSKV